jgi:drug/metabolite transporter superfamily protein YnfA
MNSSYESTRARLRALVLILAWLSTALMGAMSGAAHAALGGVLSQ